MTVVAVPRYHELIKSAPKGLPIKTDDMTQTQPVLGGTELPPVFVLGSQNDAMIMPHQIRDAADFFGTQAVMLPGVAHDVMLVRLAAQGSWDYFMWHSTHIDCCAWWGRPRYNAALLLAACAHVYHASTRVPAYIAWSAILLMFNGACASHGFTDRWQRLQDTRWHTAAKVLMNWLQTLPS